MGNLTKSTGLQMLGKMVFLKKEYPSFRLFLPSCDNNFQGTTRYLPISSFGV